MARGRPTTDGYHELVHRGPFAHPGHAVVAVGPSTAPQAVRRGNYT